MFNLHKGKIIKIIIGIVFSIVLAYSDKGVYFIEKSGRKIQCDGFLLEWTQSSALPFSADSKWVWEAINTSDGIAGYIKKNYAGYDSCFPVFLSFSANSQLLLKIKIDTLSSIQPFYSVFADTNNKILSAEWIIPWGESGLNATNYEIQTIGLNSCGDTIALFVIKGKYQVSQKNPVHGLILRAILIAIFGLLYIGLRIKFSRKTRRRQLPRL